MAQFSLQMISLKQIIDLNLLSNQEIIVMMRYLFYAFLRAIALCMSGILILFTSCNPSPDLQSYRAEILDLHREAIRAHLEKDAGFFTRNLAPGYFSVGNGVIRHPSMAEIDAQFMDYLENTEFSDYSDLEEPIIGFSDDGSLAWSIVRVRVAGARTIDTDSVYRFDTTWAWITLYQREGNRWLRMGEVSSHDQG
jgi:hypothetical protein